uniref:Uncharacterized protein n=1 Tax=mine drainage metagenome TaxID=410659 RepID=E6Q3M5_9ZZZZ
MAFTLLPLIVSCARPMNAYPYRNGVPGYSAEETVTVRMPSDKVNGFMNAMRSEAASLKGAGLQASLWSGRSGGSAKADVAVYTSAMRDARRKAQSMASFMHTHLGSIAVVSEISGSAPDERGPVANAGTITESVMVAKRAVVRVGSQGPVVLAVRYGLANGGTISVFGFSDAFRHGERQGVRIQFEARGRNGAQVKRQLDRYMQMLQNVAKRQGIGKGAIAITSLQMM